MHQGILLCLLVPHAVVGLSSQAVASKTGQGLNAIPYGFEPAPRADQPIHADPKEVVEHYLHDRKEQNVDGIMGILGDAAQVVTHKIFGTNFGTETVKKSNYQLEDYYGSSDKPFVGKNYDEQVKKVFDAEGQKVVTHSNVHTDHGWVPTRTVYSVGKDDKIDKIESWPIDPWAITAGMDNKRDMEKHNKMPSMIPSIG